MLFKIGMWALVVGSVIMGFLGYHTGSATTAVVGIVAMVLLAFVVFFLVKMSFTVGILIIKILLMAAFVVGIGFLGVRSCSMAMDVGKQKIDNVVAHQAQEKANIPVTTPNGLAPSKKEFSILDMVKGLLGGKKEQAHLLAPSAVATEQMAARTSAPAPKPAQKVVKISGVVSAVLDGNTFQLNNRTIRLFGIAAPDLRQTCINKRGEHYQCGKQAKQKLTKLILKKKVECKIVQQTRANNALATCTLQGYDVGASMITVGWAVADRNATDVYIPYEQKAHRETQGLWEGKFQAPWKFKHNAQKKNDDGWFGWFK